MVEQINLWDRSRFKEMVGWFDPTVLVKTARKALDSAMFGQYADRRLIHASLDPDSASRLVKRYDLRQQVKQDQSGAVWIDYVADLGDGFNSTYAVAYLLGRKSIDVDEAGELPRGDVLIMGGDQVYPDASRDDYTFRMLNPYRYAFPDSDKEDADHPQLFLIPGNHDWYDGLTLFLGIFCTSRKKRVGSWRVPQHRSYFALQLPNNWWIWGYDSQLGEDIDAPQADYFVQVAKAMKGRPKVIICAPTPTWLHADLTTAPKSERERYYRALNYIAYDILKVHCPAARVCAVLSGDLHHYSRYSASPSGTQFITAGGGGAFLHPTHHLEKSIETSWVRNKEVLSLDTTPGAEHAQTEGLACYPSQKESRRLALGNWKFTWTNPKFWLSLGVIYLIAAGLLALGSDPAGGSSQSFWGNVAENMVTVGLSPMFVVFSLLLWVILAFYADVRGCVGKALVGAAHVLFHLGWILFLVSALPVVNAHIASGLAALSPPALLAPFAQLGTFLLYSAEVILVGGFFAGLVWGFYLLLVSFLGKRHYNDAFSALRNDQYKHFLRLRISRNDLTIYPIAVGKTPDWDGWEVNAKAAENDQNEAVIIPVPALKPRLIEREPIVIKVPEVKTVEEVADE